MVSNPLYELLINQPNCMIHIYVGQYGLHAKKCELHFENREFTKDIKCYPRYPQSYSHETIDIRVFP